ncbi:LysE family translocator [Vibrio europaeus]|mgnify:CR=1 FL=1|uniref:Lysine transporter LysE n=3 Tax=Vibrio oreintalis group TaxID=1891919 RepID=F9T6H4_9VIBR|nr:MULTISPECIES: LysE family translocator [Vibrio oreintalis group]AIW16673.1 lysine transporter LysE [Vibrio tubiashii ATCC 19109]EGU54637.1 transporter, LysE family protein [Vibrio tubiashii ATCC 19109]EIF02340.1 threonine efflux protein [Vibrio tubiashii NCIMB 1337 = ATCC 19106]MCG9575074.1 LysE family translocator [Vibrio tubiashii]MDC5706088.1 LysE family translocator [Vibrio europaeus]
MTFTVWLSLFTICILGAMSPGPSLAMVAKHSLAGGRLNGLAAAWAHAIGIGIYAFITLIGLAVVLQQSPLLFKTISYAGAAYLAYLGYNALRSKGGVAARLESGEQTSIWQSAKEGFLISLLSPKIALFFIALFSQFVAVGDSVAAKGLIVLTPLVVDGLWYTLITFLLSSPRLIDKIRSKALLIDRLSGAVLILLAVRVILTV